MASPFRVLCYNILSPYLCTWEKFSTSTPEAISWEYRKQNLLKEIFSYNADIICLQEVPKDAYVSFFKQEFEFRGFTGTFMPKNQWNQQIDGCATLYRKDMFVVVAEDQVSLKDFVKGTIDTLPAYHQDEAETRLSKDNVVIVTILECIEGGNQFCVANTHIIANPCYMDTKLWQVSTLLDLVEHIGIQVPLVLCGDFNSFPLSNPVSLIVGMPLDASHPDLAGDYLGVLQHIRHHYLTLESAYSLEPWPHLATRIVAPRLDYIFYDVSRLKLIATLPADGFTRSVLTLDWSSDHHAIGAEFCFLYPDSGLEEERLSSKREDPAQQRGNLGVTSRTTEGTASAGDLSIASTSNILNNVPQKTTASNIIRVPDCSSSAAARLLAHRFEAAMQSYNDPSTESSERPVMYSSGREDPPHTDFLAVLRQAIKAKASPAQQGIASAGGSSIAGDQAENSSGRPWEDE